MDNGKKERLWAYILGALFGLSVGMAVGNYRMIERNKLITQSVSVALAWKEQYMQAAAACTSK